MNSNVKVDEILANIRKSIDSDIETLGGAAPVQQRGAQMRDALRDMRQAMAVEPTPKIPSPSTETSDLRSRIRKKLETLENNSVARVQQAAQSARNQLATPPVRKDFSGIMSGAVQREPAAAPLRPTYVDTDPEEDVRYVAAPQPTADWSEDPYLYNDGMGEVEQPQYQNEYHNAYGYEQQGYHEQLPSPLLSPQTEAHAETAFRQLSDAILARATGDRSLEDMTRDMLKTMLKQWLDANLPALVEELVREEIQRVARRGR